MTARSYGRVLGYETRRVVDSATLNVPSYATFGAVIASPASIIKFVNMSNIAVDLSIDGVNDHDIIPANGFCLYDVTSDSAPESGSIFEPINRQYYIKSTAGAAGVGNVYMIVRPIIRLVSG